MKPIFLITLDRISQTVIDYRLLAVFAHPDDEVFRCGGTLALLAQRGVHLHVLTFTRGQSGSCGQPPICTPEELGTVRTTEVQCSCRALGLEPPHVLDYEDGRLEEVAQEEGVVITRAHIQAIRPQVLLTWPLHGLSGHLDHVKVSQWTWAAYEQEKFAAIACHSTQAGESPVLKAPLERQSRFLGWEHFCLFSSRQAPGEKTANLLDWLEN